MKTNVIDSLNLKELTQQESEETSGGFFPVVIFGIYLSAKAVGAIICTVGAIGVATGVYIAAHE